MEKYVKLSSWVKAIDTGAPSPPLLPLGALTVSRGVSSDRGVERGARGAKRSSGKIKRSRGRLRVVNYKATDLRLVKLRVGFKDGRRKSRDLEQGRDDRAGYNKVKLHV